MIYFDKNLQKLTIPITFNKNITKIVIKKLHVNTAPINDSNILFVFLSYKESDTYLEIIIPNPFVLTKDIKKE